MNGATQAHVSTPDTANHGSDALLECLSIVTRLYGRPKSTAALAVGMPLVDHRFTPELLLRAAAEQGYAARVQKRPLDKIPPLVLPAILLLQDQRACVLKQIDKDGGATVVVPESGFGEIETDLQSLQQDYNGYCIFIQPKTRVEPGEDSALIGTGRHWFWSTLWRFRRYYTEAILATGVVNVLAIATSLFIMNVYDRVVPNNAIDTLLVLATGTLLAIGLEFIARTIRAYLLDGTGKKADLILASRLFRQALGIRLEARPASAGAFAAYLREYESLRDFFTSATLAAFADLPFLLLFIWVISLVAGPVYQVTLLAVPLVLLIGIAMQYPLARLMQRHMRESAQRHGVLVESVEGTETLKTLNAEGVLQRRWEHYTALTGDTGAKTRTLSGTMVNFATLVQQLVTIGIVVWGVHLIGAGELTVGALIAAVILSGRALAPVAQLASLMTRYQHARTSLRQLNDIMARPVERPPERDFVQRTGINGAIRLQGVKFAYPGSELLSLDNINVDILAGEHVGIVGKIGSGKSTLLKLVESLYQPAEGMVLLDDTDLRQLDPADLRRQLSYVGQEARLFDGTLRENIMLGEPLADDAALLSAVRVAGIEQWVNHHPLGFDLPVGEGGRNLSGGQRQAVAVARALLRDAPVLLLDEPASHMDHGAEQAFIQAMAARARGRTLLLVTHKPSMLALVDRLLVLDNGRLVADGQKDQVLAALSGQAGGGGGAA